MLKNVDDAVAEANERAAKTTELYEAQKQNISVLANGLRKLQDKIVRVTIDPVSLDISIAGDRHDLNAAFGALRKIGYLPSDRPKAGAASYSSWFHKDGWITVYLTFSSTQCTRVKVGTKTQTVDVYETVCV